MMLDRVDSDFSALGRPIRILIAEDDGQNRALLEEVCRSEGFEVSAVPSGHEALEVALRDPFDMVLVDASMPGMDGLELCRLLKTHPETHKIPVMVVTASLEDAVRDRAIELGAVAFMTKPFRVFELSQSMRSTLRVRHVDAAPESAPHRLRRKRADALSALASPSTLRSRLQREIEASVREGKPVVCAVLRLEDEERLSAAVGRSSTDALLGGAVLELFDLLGDKMVRGDIDEVVVTLPEEELTALALIAARVSGEERMGAGVGMEHEVIVRWGAFIADPRKADAEQLLTGARAAVDKAHRASEPGGITRAAPSQVPASH